MNEVAVLQASEINDIFPFHITFNRHLEIVALGPVLSRLMPDIASGQQFSKFFTVMRPHIQVEFDALVKNSNSLFLIETRMSHELILKGQMVLLQNGQMVFLGSPWITSIKRLMASGLTIKDFAIHDPISDYLFLLQAQSTSLGDASLLAEQLETLNRTLEARVTERTAAVEAAHGRLQLEVERREQTERALRHAERLNSLGRLVAGAAHEFNNLLTPMMCLSEVVRDDLSEEDPRRADLDAVVSAGRRAATLIANMLTFGREVESPRVPVALSKLVQSAVHLIRATVPTTIAIETDLPVERDLVVDAEPVQLNQILLNLGANARQAIGDEQGTVKFSVHAVELEGGTAASGEALRPGTYARIAIADTGCGMDDATRERVFDPFFTTKVVGEGTGMGLSIVHGIVARHGGSVRVESAPARGTTFTIDLPLAIEHVPLANGSDAVRSL